MFATKLQQQPKKQNQHLQQLYYHYHYHHRYHSLYKHRHCKNNHRIHSHNCKPRTLSSGLVWLLIGLVWLEGPLLINCKMNNKNGHLIKINPNNNSYNRITTKEQQNKKFNILSNNKRFNKIYKNISSNKHTKSNTNNNSTSRNNNKKRNHNNNHNDNSSTSNEDTNENTKTGKNNNQNNGHTKNKKNNSRRHSLRNEQHNDQNQYHSINNYDRYYFESFPKYGRNLQEQNEHMIFDNSKILKPIENFSSKNQQYNYYTPSSINNLEHSGLEQNSLNYLTNSYLQHFKHYKLHQNYHKRENNKHQRQRRQQQQNNGNIHLNENLRKSVLNKISSCSTCVFSDNYATLYDPSLYPPSYPNIKAKFLSSSLSITSSPSPLQSESEIFSYKNDYKQPLNIQDSLLSKHQQQQQSSQYNNYDNVQSQKQQTHFLTSMPSSTFTDYQSTTSDNNHHNGNNKILLNMVSDTIRLESIKHQILSKLGLKRKPNITHQLPKQFIMDTLYRTDGGDYVDFDFDFSMRNLPLHKQQNQLQKQQQQQYYKNNLNQQQNQLQYQSTMAQFNTQSSDIKSNNYFLKSPHKNNNRNNEPNYNNELNNNYLNNLHLKIDNENQQEYDDNINIYDTETLTNNKNYKQKFFNNKESDKSSYDDNNNYAVYENITLNSNYYYINRSDYYYNNNSFYNYDDHNIESKSNQQQQQQQNYEKYQQEYEEKQYQPNQDNNYLDADEFYGNTKEIITFAEKGQVFNGHRLIEFTSPSNQLPGQHLRIRSATIWIKIDIRPNLSRNRYDKLLNMTNFKLWIFRLKNDFLENRDFDRLTTLCASVNISLLNLGWQKIDLTSTVQEWFKKNKNDRLRLLIDCTGCSDWTILHLFEDDQDNHNIINQKNRKQKQKNSKYLNIIQQLNSSENQNNRKQIHRSYYYNSNHNYHQHYTHHYRHQRSQRLGRRYLKLGLWQQQRQYQERQQSSSDTTTQQNRPQNTIENPNRPFLVIYTEPNRVRRVRRRAIDCTRAINGQCCKESFYVSFKALGWDDWIIAPHGYFANYCRGDCSGPYRTPDTFQSYHTHVMEEFRKMDRLNSMKPCCAPLKFSSMSLIYYGNEGIIKRDLPKMVVDECGCP